ncbi:ankyrin repeat-containing domain protein, partial [Diaporthe sp. PMI_573]
YDSPIFICAQNGDIEGMRYLWRSGSASIDVVDPYGLGILYYSTYYCWRNRGIEASFATFRALVHAGADIGWIDDVQRHVPSLPVDTMIDLILVESAMRGQYSEPFLSELSVLFGMPCNDMWTTYISSRGFTDLHNVLLRIDTQKPLEVYLTEQVAKNQDPAILDARDLTGRTALDWAVEHGWLCAARALVLHGADVNQRRERGLSMLHLALAGPMSEDPCGSFLGIVNMLLAMGADANATDDEGWTPLHIAASWG